MEIVLQCFLLALGFLMLVKGADWFVDGAAGIADRFGVPHRSWRNGLGSLSW